MSIYLNAYIRKEISVALTSALPAESKRALKLKTFRKCNSDDVRAATMEATYPSTILKLLEFAVQAEEKDVLVLKAAATVYRSKEDLTVDGCRGEITIFFRQKAIKDRGSLTANGREDRSGSPQRPTRPPRGSPT